jgi:hypothetical protein
MRTEKLKAIEGTTLPRLPYAMVAYPKKVKTDKDMGDCWHAMRNEMLICRWCKHVGLSREEVGAVYHAPSGKTFVQWVHAIPKALNIMVVE